MRTALCLLLLAGCIEGPEHHGQGIYGTLTTSSDVQGQPDTPFAMAKIAAFVPMTTNEAASMLTEHDGSYALPLQPGTYVVCTLGAAPSTLADQWQMNCAGKCTQLVVPAGETQANWAANLSGGWWDAGDHCPH